MNLTLDNQPVGTIKNDRTIVTHPSVGNHHDQYGHFPTWAAVRVKRTAVLFDGGYFKKRWRKLQGVTDQQKLTAGDVLQYVAHNILGQLPQHEIFRCFWYDAEPFTGSKSHPISKRVTHFNKTEVFKENTSLHKAIANLPFFALRLGECLWGGWTLKDDAMKRITSGTDTSVLTEDDFFPKMNQKGVDLRIGLDIADLSQGRYVDTIVLIAGDTDLIPAMKHARKDGLIVVLDTMFPTVSDKLRAHADFILPPLVSTEASTPTASDVPVADNGSRSAAPHSHH